MLCQEDVILTLPPMVVGCLLLRASEGWFPARALYAILNYLTKFFRQIF